MFIRFETTDQVRREVRREAGMVRIKARGVEGKVKGKDRRRSKRRGLIIAVALFVLLASTVSAQEPSWHGCAVGHYGENCMTVSEGYDPDEDWDMQYWIDLWTWATHDDTVSAREVDMAMQRAMLYRVARNISASAAYADAATQEVFRGLNERSGMSCPDGNQAEVYLLHQLELIAWWSNLAGYDDLLHGYCR